ncbi:MAG TPA: hypothetical protein EYQ36_08890 [Sulfitobacter sp.]|nr:hypothetical protein [Sulfitobacter sp.]
MRDCKSFSSVSRARRVPRACREVFVAFTGLARYAAVQRTY